MSHVDLHALFSTRAIAKARSFLWPGSTNGGGSSTRGGGSIGHAKAGGMAASSSLSKSPIGAGGFNAGAMHTVIVNTELNRRDHLGRTVLHLAVIELADWALEWVEILLSVPGLQVNAVDAESGWSALHRALYAGNITAARLILMRDDVDSRLKDREGLSPIDLYNSTVDGTNPSRPPALSNPGRCELHTWGSNRNFVLGFNSDGDRTFPERVQLRRWENAGGIGAFDPLRVLDISMARLHTAIVTDEVKNNIRLCGYGTGGRLGQSAHTQFEFTPLHDFPHQVASAVVSPDHTIVVTCSGAVWTFGMNRFGQLGYLLDSPGISVSSSHAPARPAAGSSDEPIQSIPRRVLGALKKEIVIGAAASRTHSAVFTNDGSLYTWGTNKGQLGYPASGTTIQILPRKVTSVTAPITMLTATENATACLLDESKEVVVLYREGYVRISFPVTPFPSSMQPYRPPNAGDKPTIRKIASCGITFAALSTLGDVFTWNMQDSPSPTPGIEASSSLAKSAPKPQRIWSLRRAFTAVTDIAVGLDSTILLCTVSGHCFIRTKKFDAHAAKSGASTPTNLVASTSKSNAANSSGQGGRWKFARVPFLQRCIRVAANSTGGFAALRSDVPLRPIDINGATLADDFLKILPHWWKSESFEESQRGEKSAYGRDDVDDDDTEEPIERDIHAATRLQLVLDKWDLSWEAPCMGSDVHLVVNDKRIPVHSAVLAARSTGLAERLVDAAQEVTELKLHCSEYSALLFVHYLYSDDVPAVWDTRVASALQAGSKPSCNPGVGDVRLELQSLAREYNLPAWSEALAYQAKTAISPTLAGDIMNLLSASVELKASVSPASDIVLVLADRDVECHSTILRARCPVFATFYNEAEWTSLRRSDQQGKVRFDLKHIEWDVMRLILHHIYGDFGRSLFEHVQQSTADGFIDFTTRVLAVANELLLDKLKAICSAVLQTFVTLSNVCSILSDAAFYEAHELARACMHYLASSMETVLETRLLHDLPPELLKALTAFVNERQGAKMPVMRSNLLVQELMAKHATWAAEIDVGRPTGGAKKWRPAVATSASPRPSPNLLSPGSSPSLGPRHSPRSRAQQIPPHLSSPVSAPARDHDDIFTMDEDFSLDLASPARSTPPTNLHRSLPADARLTQNISAKDSVAGTASPPARAQAWAKVQPSRNKPLDLKSIMSIEAKSYATVAPETFASSRPELSIRGNTTPRVASIGKSGGFAANGPGWRPVYPVAAGSLAEIQSQQSLPSPSASFGSSHPEITRPRHYTVPDANSSRRPVASLGIQRTSSAMPTAPIYTPRRLPSNSKSTTIRGGFGAADIPWTNYTLASSSPTPSPSFSTPETPPTPHDPFASPTSSSFATIQMQQRREVEQIRESRAVRSLSEVMQQEREDARHRDLALKEKQDFERWFNEESARVQEQLGIVADSLGTNRGGRAASKSSRGGRKKPQSHANGNKDNPTRAQHIRGLGRRRGSGPGQPDGGQGSKGPP